MNSQATVVLDLDAGADECGPSPLSRVRSVLSGLSPGEHLEVRTTVADTALGVRSWCTRHATVLSEQREGRVVTFTLAP